MKKFISVIFAAFLALAMCVPAFAALTGYTYDYSAPDSGGAFIVDWAELLTADEEATLLTKIESIRSAYGIDVVLHTTDSIGEKTIVEYADDFYDYNSYAPDGLLFMLNMNNGEEGNRDYYTSTKGKAITAITDYAINNSNSRINSEVLIYLSDGDYYGAFTQYLDLIDIFMLQAETGEPYDVGNAYNDTTDYITSEIFVIFIGVVIAFIVTKVMKGKMKTAIIKREASDYCVPGSLVLTGSADVFSHKSVTKTAKPEPSSSSGGGSSTHTSSSGSSHGGGGGKF